MAISTKTKEYVALTYAKYFGRTADADTISNYASIGKTSKILKQIIKDSNIEQYSVHGDDLKAEVHNEFQNLFSRNADNTELEKYVKVLKKGKDLPINSIVKKATKFDKDVYNNKQEIAKYVAQNGGGVFDLSKVTKTNQIDVKSLTSLDDLKAKIDALPENSNVPSTFDGETYILTTGVDTGKAFVGTVKNDLFVASDVNGNPTWTVADTIDGGKGEDGLTIVTKVANAVDTDAFANNTMKSIEIVDITTSNSAGITLDTTQAGKVAENFKAVTDLKLTTTTGNIDVTVDGTKNVTATTTDAATPGTITVTGGKNIVAKTTAGTTTPAAITIKEDADATTAATIEKVTIDGLAKDSTIGAVGNGVDALKELTVKNSTGTAKLDVETAVETLKVNLDNNKSTGAITLTDLKLKTLNVDASGKDSSVLLSNASTVLETINISGNAKLSITGASATTNAAVKEINVTNTKGVAIATALNDTTKFTGGAGADSVKIGATTKAISMGAGDDTVELTTATVLGTGGSVDAGAGKDTIKMTAAQADTISEQVDGKFNGTFSNFEVLEVTGADASAVIDTQKINNVSQVNIVGAGALTTGTKINYLVNNGTVKIDNDVASQAFEVNLKDIGLGLTTDVLNLELSNTAAITNASTVTAAGVETININVADTATAGSNAVTHTLALVATSATSVVVTGNNGLTLANTTSKKITTFDASGVVANGSGDTVEKLGVTFVSANDTAGQAVKIIGGAGNDVLRGTKEANDTIIGGKGVDKITYDGGKDSFTGGEGADQFIIATGALGTTVDSRYLTIEDLTKGDIINVNAIVTIANTSFVGTKVAVGEGATFSQALDAAAATTIAGTSALTWFQFENNTYLVVDNSAAATTYQNGTDSVIKITGLVDLSNSTLSTAAPTAGELTIA